MKNFLRLLFAVILLAFIGNFFYKTPRFKIQEELRRVSKVADILFLLETLKLPSLEHIDIQVSPADLTKLIEKSNAAENGRLLKDNIPAILKTGNKNLAARVRFRGQNSNHWQAEKKSWRVTLQDGSEWRDMTEFNLIIPYDRGYLAEPFSFYLGSKLGVFSPPHGFVTMSINSSQSGVYFFAQQWGRQLLENIGLSGETDLYTDKNISSPDPQWGIYNSVDNFEKKVSLPRQEDNKENLATLLNTLQSPSQDFQNKIGNILDLDYTFNWIVHSTLTFAHGQQYTHNIVLYFDPSIKKFKPLLWNSEMNPIFSIDQMPIDNYYNPLVGRLLEIDNFAFERNKKLHTYLSKEANQTADMNFIDTLADETFSAFFQDNIKYYSNLDVWFQWQLYRKKLNQAYAKVKLALEDAQAEVKIEKINEFNYTLSITSSGFSSVEISSIDLPEKVSLITLSDSDTKKVAASASNANSLSLNDIFIHTKRLRPDQYYVSMEYQEQVRQFTIGLSQKISDYPTIKLENAVTNKPISAQVTIN